MTILKKISKMKMTILKFGDALKKKKEVLIVILIKKLLNKLLFIKFLDL